MLLEFSEGGPGIGIPYRKCVRVDGTNHGYFDLKQWPERINCIPELQDYPELFSFVQKMNAEHSVFRTAGCGTRFSSDERGATYTGFIHVLFEILHWNTNRNCYRTLFEEFKAWIALRRREAPSSKVLFSLGPASFWDHGFDGCSLRLYVEGHGLDKEEARCNWRIGLSFLQMFLSDFSGAYQVQLQNCAKRIS